MVARTMIAVIGAVSAGPAVSELAFAAGRGIAERGAVLICGGRGGVMEAAARGARAAGGHTIGVLPGYNPLDANPFIEFVLPTGMGQARNVIVVASAAAVIACAGEGGTLSEIGIALKLGRPVVGLRAWADLTTIAHRDDPAEAVALAFELAAAASRT